MLPLRSIKHIALLLVMVTLTLGWSYQPSHLPFTSVNFIAILAAAIVNMVSGFLWYGPFFSNTWLALIGKRREEISTEGVGRLYAIVFVGALVMAYVLALFIKATQATTLIDGLGTGFLVALGFVLTTNLPDYLFSSRPIKLYLLNMGYQFVSIIIMAAILWVWQ